MDDKIDPSKFIKVFASTSKLSEKLLVEDLIVVRLGSVNQTTLTHNKIGFNDEGLNKIVLGKANKPSH